MHKNVYLYVFDTMADWEIGYICAELNSGRYFAKDKPIAKVITLSIDQAPVTTMGGINILPDLSVSEFEVENASLIILPGGDTWTDTIHDPMLEKIEEALRAGILVGAICGATVGLARIGMLNETKHTSNDLGYLKMSCPEYTGESHYQQEPAVTSGNLITANGVAPLEFAVEILKAMDVFSPQTLNAWSQLYRTHEPKYFYELMESLEEQ